MKYVIRGFSSGELSPEFLGRDDLDITAMGAERIENWIVDGAGPVYTRPGFRHCVFTDAQRLVQFEQFILLISPTHIWVTLNGEYVLDTPIHAAHITNGVVSSISHKLPTGAIVQLAGDRRVWRVTNITADTFTLQNWTTNTPAGVTQGVAQIYPVLRIQHDFPSLTGLRFQQTGARLVFTHSGIPPKQLSVSGNVWKYENFTFSGALPLNETVSVSDTGAFIRSVRVTNPGSGYTPETMLTVADATGTGAHITPVVDTGAIIGVNILEGGRGYQAPTITASIGTGAVFETTLFPTTAEFIVTVTAVTADGETGMMRPRLHTGSINFSAFPGSATYSWTQVPGAQKYNIYRSLIYPEAGQAYVGLDMGYIATSFGVSFTDVNYVANFQNGLSIYNNPFAPGAIRFVNIIDPGHATSIDAELVAVDGPAARGFVGWPMVKGGEIVGVFIANHGENYTANTSFNITGTDLMWPGSSEFGVQWPLPVDNGVLWSLAADFEVAWPIDVHPTDNDLAIMWPVGIDGNRMWEQEPIFSVVVSPLTGTFPSIAFNFQGRFCFAATDEAPSRLFFSKVAESGNFSTPTVASAADSYAMTLDQERISRILHAVDMNYGLLVFTERDIRLLRAEDGRAVTAFNAVSFIQSRIDVSDVEPLRALDVVVFADRAGRGLFAASPSPQAIKFDITELSRATRHLFTGRRIQRISADNHGHIYCVMSDGNVVAGNFDQSALGLFRITTEGAVTDTVTVDDVTYFLVRRNGITALEMFQPSEPIRLEDGLLLDGCFSTRRQLRNSTLSRNGNVWTASANEFIAGHVGQLLYAGSGRGEIVERLSPTSVRVLELTPMTEIGNWWIAPRVQQLTEIPHEGRVVMVVADGKVVGERAVVNGRVDIPFPAGEISVGYPFTASLKTAPVGGIGGNLVNIFAITLDYVYGTGITVEGVEIPARFREPWGEPNAQTADQLDIALPRTWNKKTQLVLECKNVHPAKIRKCTLYYRIGQSIFEPNPPAPSIADPSGGENA